MLLYFSISHSIIKLEVFPFFVKAMIYRTIPAINYNNITAHRYINYDLMS